MYGTKYSNLMLGVNAPIIMPLWSIYVKPEAPNTMVSVSFHNFTDIVDVDRDMDMDMDINSRSTHQHPVIRSDVQVEYARSTPEPLCCSSHGASCSA